MSDETKPVFTEEFKKDLKRASEILGYDFDDFLEEIRKMFHETSFCYLEDMNKRDSGLRFSLSEFDGLWIGGLRIIPDMIHIYPIDVANWKEYFAFRLLESSTGENDE